jgi:hypothetical protein
MAFDLDAISNDDDPQPFPFTLGGETFTLPGTLDLVAASYLSEADRNPARFNDSLAKMLGAEQWERLKASPAVLDHERYKALMDAYRVHLGVSSGESPASTDS